MAFLAFAAPLFATAATAATTVSAAAGIGSGVLGLIGGMNAAASAEANGAFQAAIMKNQATQADLNATRAETDAGIAFENAGRIGFAGQLRGQDQDFAAAQEIGEVRAAQGASGLVGGSHDKVIRTLDFLAGRDRTRLAVAGANDATQARAQGQNFLQEAADLRSGANVARADASMTRVNAKSEATAARLGGIGSLLDGFTNATGSLLDGSQSLTVRSNLNKSWQRVRGRA
jgi:hypothetical protein